MKHRLTLKKSRGKPTALKLEGPKAALNLNGFVNTFNSAQPQECELPLVQEALTQVIDWAQTNRIELNVHPLVTRFFELDTERRAATANTISAELAKTYPKWEQLYPHQRDGLEFVQQNAQYHGVAKVLLADDPRLGKSPLALASLYMLKVRGPVLILCPKALVHQWAQYVRQWLPIQTTATLTGSSAEKSKQLQTAIGGFTGNWPLCIITNWESLRGVPELTEYHWQAFIGDEAHKIKNRKSQVSKLTRKIKTAHTLLLSATFVENTPEQWWSPLNIIQPTLFTSYWRWVGNYVKTQADYNGLKLIGAKNTAVMKAQVAPYILQRKSEDVAGMLPKLYENFAIPLEGQHGKHYRTLEERARVEIADETISPPNKIALITALRQCAIHPALLEEGGWNWEASGKLELLQTLLENNIPEDEQVVLFSSFVMGCKLAAWAVRDLGGSAVYAGADADDNLIPLFQQGKYRTLCATPQKGGVGLNLYNADWVVYLDLPWSTIDLRQSEERARAIGKTKPVTVVRLTAANTIDEYVSNRVMLKMDNVSDSEVIYQAEQWLKGVV